MAKIYDYKSAIKLNMLDQKRRIIHKMNEFAIIAILVCGAVGVLLNYILRMLKSPGGMYLIYTLCGCALCFLYIYMHEFTHALAVFAVKGRFPHVKFEKLAATCGARDIAFTKAQYVFVASCPLVLYCAALIPLCVLLPPLYFPIPFLPLCYNVFGSLGDLYMIKRMLAAPKGSIIIDEGAEVGAYMPVVRNK
ncbi:MAG: DUF3267 domain-containing protein [Roseburia sp.]|nr:DUF3267 domain-containing protein [Roseburia sp.]